MEGMLAAMTALPLAAQMVEHLVCSMAGLLVARLADLWVDLLVVQ
jgi:hypothetical protein